MNLTQFLEISPLKSDQVPYPRSGHRAVATDSDLWIWGGFHPSNDDDQPQMFAEVS